ncbi:MAG TPA: thiamine phosphate synthase [Gemmatimonadales bacterium]|nr:thiamine phosphate synthase [Gemmatimonadales bacterium]
MVDNVAALVRLMVVTDDALLAGRDLAEVGRAVERGGASAIQLRLKRATPRELADAARRLLAVLTIPVLINDRPDVALAVRAAGVHLGPDDLPVPLARRIAPAGFVIGASVGSAAEASAAAAADYWGIGPWRVTATKADAGAALGRAGFEGLVRVSEGRPCLAIGGIRPLDVAEVLEAGGSGVAVAAGILSSDDVEDATRRYAAASR